MIRTVVIYVFVVLAVRLMGKRQVADMQTSELVTTLIVSEVASLPMQNIDQPLLSGIVPIMILVAVEIIISIAMMKSKKIRGVICGHPIIVIKDGKTVESEMKRLRIGFEDLYSLLRQEDVFDIKDVKYGIIEPNGKLSVMKKEDFKGGMIESEDLKEELEDLKRQEKLFQDKTTEGESG